MAASLRENSVLLERSRREALVDPLTGLDNRRKLMLDLRRATHDISEEIPHALMLFDLDGFKQYNDRYGHPAGDALLNRLGDRLTMAVEEGEGHIDSAGTSSVFSRKALRAI
jgi:diguanylate cyclase (GGDEF)-like protein